MDITRAPLNTSVSKNEPAENDRQLNERSASALFQARYGEKQKEARPVKKALDKDDFMRIMITEMKHQDPTKPMDADRMATQMAQITSVEQMKNVSTSLDKLADKSSASDRLAMSMMIGKTVTVDKSRFSHQKATVSPINFDLPESATKVKLTVLDERGEEVAVRELDPMQAGPNSYNWDGINASNMQAASGSYSIRIDAENAKGGKISVNPISKETVVGVTFEGGEANFLVGNPKTPQKVGLKNITRLEGDAQTGAAAIRNKSTAATEGSNGEFELPENLKSKLGLNNPEGQAALDAAKSQLSASADDESSSDANGFPNGLND